MRHNGDQHYNDTRNPDEILAEIERTRSEMDSTLNAIEHRLTPGQLLDQGVDYLRRSGGNEFVQNLGTQAKYNPMPVALVGIGLAWLMASSKRPPDYSAYSTSSSGPGLGERASSLAGSAKDKLSGTTQSVRDRMSEGSSAVRDRISRAGESLSSMHESTRQRMSDLSYSARNQMDRARSGMDYMMREQPLALGAIGLAVGAVLAAMAPRTQKEDELLGETRDRLMDQAKEAGKEKLEQAKEVANTAVGAAKEQVSKQSTDKPAGSASSTGGTGASPSKQPSTLGSTSTAANKPSVTPKPATSSGTGSGSSGPGSTSIGNTGGSRNVP